MAQYVATGEGDPTKFNKKTHKFELPDVGFEPNTPFEITLSVDIAQTNTLRTFEVTFRRDGTTSENCFYSVFNTDLTNVHKFVTAAYPAAGQGPEWGPPRPATGCLDFKWLVIEWETNTFGPPEYAHWNITLKYTAPTGTAVFCEYGTQPNALAEVALFIDENVLDTVLFRVGARWAKPLFALLLFRALDVRALCSSLPPTPPPITLETLTAPLDLIWEYFNAMAWWSFCECAPGPTTPIPPPQLPTTEPPGWPSWPSATCLPDDICATLVRIQEQLAAVQRTLGADLAVDTLVQRWQLPFKTIPGAKHAGLRGVGSFPLSRVVGLQVDVAVLPDGTTFWEGKPEYIKDVGWMSVNSGEVMLEEKRITRYQYQWLPSHCALATSFGYWLHAGVSIDVTELVPEP